MRVVTFNGLTGNLMNSTPVEEIASGKRRKKPAIGPDHFAVLEELVTPGSQAIHSGTRRYCTRYGGATSAWSCPSMPCTSFTPFGT
jgi:hypothetical protein